MKKLSYNCITKIGFGEDELSAILKYYGVKNKDLFLKPNESVVESYKGFDNIQKAVMTYIKHIKENKQISLLIDCDLDGYSSAAVFYMYTKQVCEHFGYEFNIKMYHHEGKIHGLLDTIDLIEQDDSDLVVIPDAGTSDSTECARLYEKGKEVIVLDHHDVPLDYNPAIVVNNQHSKNITNKAMTGVGVVYKFCKYVDELLSVNFSDDYLDWVAVGMIADRADMFDLETRYYIFKGLNILRNNESKSKLLSHIIEKQSYSMQNRITITTIGFYVAPLFNALIRLGSLEDKEIMFEAMCNSDRHLIRKIRGKGEVSIPIQDYSFRDCQSYQRKQQKMTLEQSEKISEGVLNSELGNLPIVVYNASEEVTGTFTGLIANKLVDIHKKPVLLLRKVGNDCRGSGRGFDKCEILNFNEWCVNTGLFTKVAGHPNAFGVTIPVKNTHRLFHIISNLKMKEYVHNVICEFDITKLSDSTIKSIGMYDYVWGSNIDEPLFYINNIVVNKFNIELLGAKQNRIEFMYRNIRFSKSVRSGNLIDAYNQICSLGDNIKFEVIGNFKVDYRNDKSPLIKVEDFTFEKVNTAYNMFG